MPDPQTFLYIKPDYDDDSVKYLKLTEPIRDYAVEKGFTVVDLEADEATPSLIYAALEQYDPLFVFSCGHGCPTLTTTQDYADTFWVSPGCGEHTQSGSMVDMLRGRVVFLLSCYCGESLVPVIFNAGGAGVVGYSDEFTWVVDTDYPITEDPFASTFYDPPNYFVSLLLDGASVSTAYAKTKERYNTLINTWNQWANTNRNASPANLARAHLTVSLLEHDRDVMVALAEGVSLYQVSSGNVMPLLVGGAMVVGLLMLSKKK